MSSPDEFTPVVLWRLARAHPVWVAGAPLAVAALFVLIVALRPPMFRAETTFLPDAETDPVVGGTGAGQVRPALGGGGLSDVPGPEFYLELLNSRRVLAGVARMSHRVQPEAPPQALADIWGIGESDSALREEAVMRRLRRHLSVHAGWSAGLVHVTTEARTPTLAASLASSMVEVTNRFNREARRTRARAEREFLEARLDTVRAQRAAADDRLVAFLTENRVRADPALQFAEVRLRTDVEFLRQQERAVLESLERARVAEVRSTPVLTVVQPALPAARPRPKRLLLVGLFGFVVGALVGWPVAVWRGAVEVARSADRADWRAYRTPPE